VVFTDHAHYTLFLLDTHDDPVLAAPRPAEAFQLIVQPMAAGMSEHVPRILDEISQMPTAPEERSAGLPGHYRIEPREGRVEQ
jgi:hypothetical protein